MVQEALKYFKNAGIVFELVDGSISVSSKSLRTKLTSEETKMVNKYNADIIKDLSSTTKLESGEESRIVTTFSASTQSVPPLKRKNPNIVNTFNGKTGNIIGVNSVNSATGDVKFGYVSSFNGATGSITGVNSLNGATGSVIFGLGNLGITASATEINVLDGDSLRSSILFDTVFDSVVMNDGGTMKQVSISSWENHFNKLFVTSFNGATGAITGVNSLNGHTGAIDLKSTQTTIGGVTLGGGGATFSNPVTVDANFLYINGALVHNGDADTKLTFSTDQIALRAGGNNFITGTSALVHMAAGLSADAGATFGGGINVGGNIIIAEDGFIGTASDDERIIFDGSGNDITLKTSNVMIDRKLIHNGDGDTFLDFTTDRLKVQVGGSEVMDGTTSGIDMNDFELVKPNLKDYSEAVNAIGSVNSNTAVDFEGGNVQTVTIGGNCEFSFSNPPASGKAGTVTLIITNGGAHTTTFASAIKWPSNVAPSLTTSGIDIITFLTIDAGTNVYGFVGGLNFS